MLRSLPITLFFLFLFLEKIFFSRVLFKIYCLSYFFFHLIKWNFFRIKFMIFLLNYTFSLLFPHFLVIYSTSIEIKRKFLSDIADGRNITYKVITTNWEYSHSCRTREENFHRISWSCIWDFSCSFWERKSVFFFLWKIEKIFERGNLYTIGKMHVY